MVFTSSNSKAYDYFGLFFGPEKTEILFFKVVDKDSLTKKCFLTSPELDIKELEANNFALTNQDFYYYYYSEKLEIDIQTIKKTTYYEGGGPIDGMNALIKIYKFDNETLKDLNKYCGTYYSINKKDSIVINVQDSLSLIATFRNQNNNKKEVNSLYPINSEKFISKIGIHYEFKLRNFIPWQIMYVYEGQEYFFYKEL